MNTSPAIDPVRSHELDAIRLQGITDPNAHQMDLAAVASQAISLGQVGESLTDSQKQLVLCRLNHFGLHDFDHLPLDAVFMLEKIDGLSVEQSLEIIRAALKQHGGDYNVLEKDYVLWEKLAQHSEERSALGMLDLLEKKEGLVQMDHVSSDGELFNDDAYDYTKIVDWNLQVRMEAALIAYWSPYTEVRSVTDPFDDTTVACETFRVYFIGIIWTCIGSFINQFFTNRQPAISLHSNVVQVFIYPSGMLLAAILPAWNIGFGRYKFNLNPGPWTFKEQLLATLCYSVSGANPYISSNLHVQRLSIYYNNTWVDFGYEVLLILLTQFMGFGFAGLLRKFVIFPVLAMWPDMLPTLALNKALMKPLTKEKVHGWSISAYKFFFIVCGLSFLYYWLPNYLIGILYSFNWMTWIAPNNLNLVNVTGFFHGAGINPLPTFEWLAINFNACLQYPVWTTVQQYLGTFIAAMTTLGLWYSNYKWSKFMPMNDNRLYSNKGKAYDVQQVVDERSLFDKEKYAKYGPPFYTAGNLVSYGSFFAIYTFTAVYEFTTQARSLAFSAKLFVKQIINFRKQSVYEGFEDPFSVKMRRYPEVPEWCFFSVLIVALVFAIVCVKIYPAETPVWAIFFALGINLVFLIPLTVLRATTGTNFGLNVLVELIIGYAIPGNGLALNFIKALGYNIDGQAQNYTSDQKVTHYTGIAPRALFRIQMLSTLVNAFVSLGTMEFLFTKVQDYCLPTNKIKFTCPGANTFYLASIAWGVIGPKKTFQLYPVLKYCFLIGAVLGLICVVFKWYGPRRITRVFQPTLWILGMVSFAPYNLSYYTMGLYMSIIFMWYIRTWLTAWWSKYNYILTGGLLAGMAFSSIIVFFAVQYHNKSIDWWGNNAPYMGAEGLWTPGLNTTLEAPDGYFGPRIDNYPQ